TGASAALRAQASIAQNLANSDTAGFKAALIQTDPYAVQGAGLASRVDATMRDGGFNSSAGAQITTNNPLDVSLRSDAWLAVQDSAGQEAYTRAGNLHVTENGQLVTASGHPVLSENGPITIPPHQSATIAADGTISIVPQGQGPEVQANVGRLRVVQNDAAALARGVDGLMRRSDPTPPPALAGNVLTPGAVEGSNVNAADALVSMIALSRQFDLQVQVLHNTDQNAQAATSLLRLGS
ncbi:MAG TPA: flagellar basal body rod protein FlgF, partial [Rudaea sp.]